MYPSSEKQYDVQEQFKASPSHNTSSPEVTSKAMVDVDDASEVVKSLTEKLSAALVNVSAKEELVKQHVKVAEEAVAGWEKAENDLAVLKEQLDSAAKQNSSLEDRLNHLDGALKECVRQLRLVREEQEEQVHEAIAKRSQEWGSTKLELENRIIELQTKLEKVASTPIAHLNLHDKLNFLEKENMALKLKLQQQSEELERRTIERDLSTQAAEMASKQNLQTIKKVAKLEAECRKLRKCSLMNNDNKSAAAASSIYVESLTDSQSDSGERFNALDMEMCKSSGFDLWASALITELDQFKSEKGSSASCISKNLASSSVQINLMDDFLEVERLAALPETKQFKESDSAVEMSGMESSLRAELNTMINQTVQLEQKLAKHEQEKTELKMALVKSQKSGEAAQVQLIEALMKLEDLQRELHMANDTKQSIESQLRNMEAEALTMSSKVKSLETEVKKEKALSVEIRVKCRQLEAELVKKQQELEAQQTFNEENNKPKIKQEDLAVATGRLAECQKTIVSLRKQLESLVMIEDFLIDTARIPDFSQGREVVPRANGELWKLHPNETFLPKIEADSVKIGSENLGHSPIKNGTGKLPVSSSIAASSTQVRSERNRNGFAKFFSRTKDGIQLEI